MIELIKSKQKEIPKIVELECSDDTSEFILPYSPDQHREEMGKENIVYLSIYSNQVFVGFIILAREEAGNVEFRRIVVSCKGNGFGQAAICRMEEYCKTVLNSHRVWLDVFKSNSRGQYIYKKLGYTQFKTSGHGDNCLLFFEKKL